MSSQGSAVSDVAEPPSGEPWTVLRMMRWTGEYLGEKGVDRGRLDGELLLADVLGLSRLDLYLQHDRPLTEEELARFKPLLLRRARREPVQYILGRAAFRELDLLSDRRALVPRPETEGLVQEVLDWASARSSSRAVDEGLSALDIGTGTGCIALSLAREGRFTRIAATDASDDALELARENTVMAGLEDVVELLRGDLFEPVIGRRFDVVVSNPPYVADSEREALAPEVAVWEPECALFAGPDGLDVLRALVAGAADHLGPGGLLALETGAGQTGRVAELVRQTGAFREPRVRADLAGRPRIVLAESRVTAPDDAEEHRGRSPKGVE